MALVIKGGFDPYVSPPPNVYLSPSYRHIFEYESAPLRMSWKKSGSKETQQWQLMARAKLAELSGYSCGDAVYIDVNENQTHKDKNESAEEVCISALRKEMISRFISFGARILLVIGTCRLSYACRGHIAVLIYPGQMFETLLII